MHTLSLHATLAPYPGCFLLSHLSIIMLTMASLAVHCLSVSVECWPLESWGLASFRLNSQFLCQVIVSSIWRLECEFKSDNSGKSPDLGLTGRVFTVKSQGLECFIPWLLLQFSFFLLVKMDFINAWYDTVVNCLLYICSEFPHLCFFIVYNLDF